MLTDLIDSMVEITMNSPEDFLKIKETLTRIGIANKKQKTLYQSCHILHKRGKYYICHFKELFRLDGRTSDVTEEDLQRRNTIQGLLASWGLLDITEPHKIENKLEGDGSLWILPHKEKSNWKLVPKYTIGNTN